MTIWHTVLLLTTGALISLTGVLFGGYIMFRGRSDSSVFIGKQPQGGAFSIKDGLDGDEFPSPAEPGVDEQRVLNRANKFLKNLGA